jgi:hypothetical protein
LHVHLAVEACVSGEPGQVVDDVFSNLVWGEGEGGFGFLTVDGGAGDGASAGGRGGIVDGFSVSVTAEA